MIRENTDDSCLNQTGGINLSKVICEICGTAYPDSAVSCPICGYSGSMGESPVSLEEEVPQSAPRRSEPVKGGRFSKQNRKKEHTASAPAQPRREVPKAAHASGGKKAGKRRKNTTRRLVITVIVLLILVLLVGAYIAVRFFIGRDAYQGTSLPSDSGSVPVSSSAAPVDTAVVCTDLQIGNVELEKGIELTGAGRGWQISVTPVPENVTDPITYYSADETVATVTVSDGQVRILAVGPGSTTITVSCGTVSKSFPVVCSFDEQPTDPSTDDTGKLVLDKDDISFFAVDEAYTLNPGTGIDPKAVSWASDDEDVAVVDGEGKVTAVGAGTCNITAQYNGETVSCIVRCEIEPEPVEDAGPPYLMSHTDVTLRIGESFTLHLLDKNRDVVDVKWESGNKVTIDGNEITGAASGIAYVTCTHNGEEFKCIVRVG